MMMRFEKWLEEVKGTTYMKYLCCLEAKEQWKLDDEYKRWQKELSLARYEQYKAEHCMEE